LASKMVKLNSASEERRRDRRILAVRVAVVVVLVETFEDVLG
jgi:hypothetical protein